MRVPEVQIWPLLRMKPIRTMGTAASRLASSKTIFGDFPPNSSVSGMIFWAAIAPMANLNPERTFPSLFETVHGSAPDIYGQNIANPIAMIWSGALMLDFLGCKPAHDAIVAAIEQVLAQGPRTRDLGGTASTTEVGEAIAAIVAKG